MASATSSGMPDVLSAGELVSAPAPSDCQLSRYHRVAKKLASVCGPMTRHTASKVKSPKSTSKTNTQTRIAVEDRRIKTQEEFSEEALKIKKPRRVAKTLDSKRLPRSPRNPTIATRSPRYVNTGTCSPRNRKLKVVRAKRRVEEQSSSPVSDLHRKWRMRGALHKNNSPSSPHAKCNDSGYEMVRDASTLTSSSLRVTDLGSRPSRSELGRGEHLANATQLYKSGPSSTASSSSSTLTASDLDMCAVMREKLRKTYIVRNKRK